MSRTFALGHNIGVLKNSKVCEVLIFISEKWFFVMILYVDNICYYVKGYYIKVIFHINWSCSTEIFLISLSVSIIVLNTVLRNIFNKTTFITILIMLKYFT